GDRGGDIQVRRVLNIGLPRHRYRDHERVHGEQVDEAEHAVLIKQHEADENQAAGEQVCNIQRKAIHYIPRETNSSSAASRPSISAAPRKSETRNTRILATAVSKTANMNPPIASLAR